MKLIQSLGFQGDVGFVRVTALPAGLRAEKRAGPIVVAHSETGHHHVVEARGDAVVSLFRGQDSMVCYLQIEGAPADVVHHRPFDTHETVCLPPGLWEVRRQREATPEGWRRVED